MPRPKQTKKTIIGDQRWKKKKREGTWNVIWYHTMALRLGELPRLTAVWRVLQRSVLFLWQHAPNRKSALTYGDSGLKWFFFILTKLEIAKDIHFQMWNVFDIWCENCLSFRYNLTMLTKFKRYEMPEGFQMGKVVFAIQVLLG